MDSRTRFAIGGVSTVVASVAVVCAVALTNSVALADTAGAPVGRQPDRRALAVRLRRSGRPGALGPRRRRPHRRRARAAEAVPAPAPHVVATATASSSVRRRPTTCRPPRRTSLPSRAPTAAVAAVRPPDVAAVRDWAARGQWSQARVDAWILRLEEKRAAEQDRAAQSSRQTQSEPSSPSEDGGRMTASDSSKTSAKAGHDAGRQTEKSWLGAKKDRSRDSPDRRD